MTQTHQTFDGTVEGGSHKVTTHPAWHFEKVEDKIEVTRDDSSGSHSFEDGPVEFCLLEPNLFLRHGQEITRLFPDKDNEIQVRRYNSLEEMLSFEALSFNEKDWQV